VSITNLKGLPLPVVRAISQDDHISQGSDLGAATVGAPVRQVALRRKHRGELTEDASNRIWPLFGAAVHVVLERAGKDQGDQRRRLDDALVLVDALVATMPPQPPGQDRQAMLLYGAQEALTTLREFYDAAPQPFRTFVEERWEMEVLGWRVAARCDHLTLDDDGVLTDYKVSSVWSVKDGEAKPEWIAQLNVTRYLCTHVTGLRPARLQATVFCRDWRKNERLRYGTEYPEVQVVSVPVPLWSDGQCLAYLNERVAWHQEAQRAGGPLPECTAEERWEKPTIFAVTKKGRKTAVRLYTDPALAEAHAKADSDLTVVVRPGESTRCASYCDVLPFCTQGQQILAALQAPAAEPA
jgi:hypothetical protein